MGFGVAFLGYCFLFLHSAGLGVIGAPMLAYGFFLASRLDSHFLRAAIAAMFLLPRGVYVLIDIFLPMAGVNVELSERFPWLNISSYLLFFVAWFFMIFYHCMGVRRIAIECEHEKLQRTASRQLYISALFILLAISLVICQQLVDPQIGSFALIAFYVVLLFNMFFTHTCQVLITSEGQYEKDKQDVEEQNRLAMQKRAKDMEKEREIRERKEQRKARRK
ncbi:MAG: hypothetical protein J1E00_08330 [Oscillospiraceae bacterium]|nr:hypothetical protein [Oscillospiraceae bacterium]